MGTYQTQDLGGSGGPASQVIETGGPTTLSVGAIPDKSVVRREGAGLKGSSEFTYDETTKLLTLLFSQASVGGFRLANSNNANVNAHARQEVEVGGASGGDPFTRYLVSGVTFWSHGIENGVSDQYVIANANGLAASKALTFQQTTLFGRLGGGIAYPITATKTGAYSVTLADHTVPCNATSAAFDVTLPNANTCSGAVFVIKKTDASANAVTVKSSGGTLDGVAAATGIALAAQWDTIMVQSDGTNWLLIAPSV